MNFPTNPTILDTCVRANENPLSDGGKWSSTTIRNTHSAVFQLLSNTGATIDNSIDSQYWNDSSFGPDMEVYYDVLVTLISSAFAYEIFARTQNEDTASMNGYFCGFTTNASGQYSIGKVVNNATTTLGTHTDASNALKAGDKFGMSVVGNTTTVYRWASGWITIMNANDSAVTGTGHIGPALNIGVANTSAFANFGGGTVITDSFTLTGKFKLS